MLYAIPVSFGGPTDVDEGGTPYKFRMKAIVEAVLRSVCLQYGVRMRSFVRVLSDYAQNKIASRTVTRSGSPYYPVAVE